MMFTRAAAHAPVFGMRSSTHCTFISAVSGRSINLSTLSVYFATSWPNCVAVQFSGIETDSSLKSASASASWRVASFSPFFSKYAFHIFTPLSLAGVMPDSATSTKSALVRICSAVVGALVSSASSSAAPSATCASLMTRSR